MFWVLKRIRSMFYTIYNIILPNRSKRTLFNPNHSSRDLLSQVLSRNRSIPQYFTRFTLYPQFYRLENLPSTRIYHDPKFNRVLSQSHPRFYPWSKFTLFLISPLFYFTPSIPKFLILSLPLNSPGFTSIQGKFYLGKITLG